MIKFQLLIMISIIGSGLFLNINAVKIVSILWVCETILMVYSSWLLFYQFLNIGISFIIGYAIGLFRDKYI